MEIDKQQSSGGIYFEQLDFDLLERSLQNQDSSEMVFQTLSIWLWGRLNVEFIAFYFKNADAPQYVKCFSNDESIVPAAEAFFQERKERRIPKSEIGVSADGFISFPFEDFKLLTEKAFLVIGKNTETQKVFSQEQYLKLRPVIRILNTSLLHIAASSLHEERNRLQYAFSRYVSPELVQSILLNEKGIQVGGEKQCLSVIFTDLRDFTPLTEKMAPSLLIRVLNMYLNEMTQVIVALGGTIDKFEGDAIMAFFGAPHSLPDHAVRCCLAALRMKKMETILNEQLIHEKLIPGPLFTRIGINTGDMIVGNIGSLQRLDYTIIGSNVNIASRIENANKQYNTSILISGETFRLVAPYFNCQYCDTTYLKGVKDKVSLYELISERTGITPSYMNFENTEPVSDIESLDADVPDLKTI